MMLLNELDPPQPLVSVVIPTRNGTGTVGAQLRALANQRSAPPFEVIISDNRSEDSLRDFLKRVQQDLPDLTIRYIEAAAKKGAGHARNVGAQAAQAPLILFCDCDDVVSERWVRALSDGLQTYDSVGGPLDERRLNSPGSQEQAFASKGLPVGLGFLPYPLGSNCGVRREVWEKLQGFDESYTTGGEEVEFYWRLQLQGYSLGFVPEAIVYYRHRTDIVGNMRQAFRHGVSSCRLASAFKAHAPPESFFRIIKAWVWLCIRIPLIASPKSRLGYVRSLAHKVGQIVGSTRYRIVHLA